MSASAVVVLPCHWSAVDVVVAFVVGVDVVVVVDVDVVVVDVDVVVDVVDVFVVGGAVVCKCCSIAC